MIETVGYLAASLLLALVVGVGAYMRGYTVGSREAHAAEKLWRGEV